MPGYVFRAHADRQGNFASHAVLAAICFDVPVAPRMRSAFKVRSDDPSAGKSTGRSSRQLPVIFTSRLRATHHARQRFRLRAGIARIKWKRHPQGMPQGMRLAAGQQQAAARHVDCFAAIGALPEGRGPSEPRRKPEPYSKMLAALHGRRAVRAKEPVFAEYIPAIAAQQVPRVLAAHHSGER